MASLKRLLVGTPIRTARLAHERLTRKTALAVFSSDALSSTAYATEEILLVLAAAYVAPIHDVPAFTKVIPVSIGIATLLIIVAISYRQTIHAYPSGGGAYIVAKDNLGTLPGLVASGVLYFLHRIYCHREPARSARIRSAVCRPNVRVYRFVHVHDRLWIGARVSASRCGPAAE